MNEYVLKKTSYDIKFAEKGLDNSTILSSYDNPEKDDEFITYHNDKEKFEKTQLKIIQIHPFTLVQ